MESRSIAVLDDNFAYMRLRGKTYKIPLDNQSHSLLDLLGIAKKIDAVTLWILPGCGYSQLAAIKPQLFTESQPDIEVRASTMRDVPMWIKTWKTHGTYDERASIFLAFPEHDPRWGWQEITEPHTLLHAIQAVQDALGLPLEWSPGHMGIFLLEQVNSSPYRASWLHPAHLPDKVASTLARDATWKRPITQGQYLHVFDKNSMYLGACTSTNVGEGSPIHMGNGPLDFNPKYPGLWRISVHEDSPTLMPSPLARGAWHWTPELKVALDLGLQCTIEEAYVWPIYHQTLRKWAEDLWTARANLKQARNDAPSMQAMQMYNHAYEAIKAIATQGLGWLAHKPMGGNLQWYRPDWWSMVVSSAKAKMFYKCKQLREQGHDIVYLNVDALGMTSNEEDVYEAFPHMLERKDALGGFKHAFSLPIDNEVRRLFEESTRFATCRSRLLELATGDRSPEPSTISL